MNHTESEKLFRRGSQKIPGGVNSPVRAFRNVGGTPIFIVRGEGAFIWDADGNRYLDFCGSWGPLLLGHAHPEIISAVQRAVKNGLSFGACTPGEVEMAERLCRRVPSMEKVRLVTSGTEATMTAVRLARAFTRRDKIIKFEGCYHGHSDAFLIAAGSGLLTHGIASSAGVTEGVARDTIVVPYNDLEALQSAFRENKDQIAAVIVEPVPGNMGIVLPLPGFLEGICDLARSAGTLTIFDEVINGFRFAPTTYAETIGLTPDLTTLGKIIGGGMPIGAVGGRADIMSQLAPEGAVYQAGTLSGNPVAVAAGIAALELIETLDYVPLVQNAARIAEKLNQSFQRHGVLGHCAHAGALFTPFFTSHPAPMISLSQVKTCDTQLFARFFHGMLEQGFYLSPAQFEASFLSAAHTPEQIQSFLAAADSVLAALPPDTLS